jgi:hypothetical protein
MKTINDYVADGIPSVINSMGECRRTRTGSIIFPNGRVASIVRPMEDPEKYSVATCDYEGYFDWEVLNKYFETDNGAVICDTEEEVCKVLECIKNL